MKRAVSIRALVIALASLALSPASALAHAQLVGTSPQSGSTVKKEPKEVIFKYNQAVGGTVGAVRVYNAQGDQVDNLDVSHPGGHQSWMGVGLEAEPSRRHLHGDLPGDLGRHPHRLRRPRLQPRARRCGAEVHGRGSDLQKPKRRGDQTRLRRDACARLPIDRPDGRRARLPSLRLAAGDLGSHRGRRAALGSLEGFRAALWPPPGRGRRSRRLGQRPRVPPPGRKRRRRVAMGLAQGTDHQRHAAQPLRHRVGPAGHRLGSPGRLAPSGVEG